jgi:hypothetical protein
MGSIFMTLEMEAGGSSEMFEIASSRTTVFKQT